MKETEDIEELNEDVQLYQNETDVIKGFLCEHSSNINLSNNKYLDECMSVALKILNLYLESEGQPNP